MWEGRPSLPSPGAPLLQHLHLFTIQKLMNPILGDFSEGFITSAGLMKSLAIGNWFNLQSLSFLWGQGVGLKVPTFCWRRSFKGHNHQLAPSQKLVTSSPVLGMCIPPVILTLGIISKIQPRESKVLLRPPGLNRWLNQLRPLYKLLRFWQVGMELNLSMATQNKPHLLKLPPTHLEWSALSSVSPYPGDV